MNKENAGKLWKIIQEAGDYLKGQLPNHPNHPKGRNPYAHVAICVKSKFQKSYMNHVTRLVTKSYSLKTFCHQLTNRIQRNIP